MQLSPLLFKNNLEINSISKNNKQFLKFYRSTVIIDFIIKSIKNRYQLNKVNLAIPFLYCRSTINYIKSNNKDINIIFYDTEIDSEINLEVLDNKLNYDIIVIVNYFQKAQIKSYKSINPNKYIIEDCTHLVMEENNIESFIDFQIFSPYKFYPMPFLGICLINPKQSWIKEYYLKEKYNLKNYLKLIFLIKEDIIFIVKNIILQFFSFKRVKEISFKKKNTELIKNNILLPSPLSSYLFKYIFYRNSNIYKLHNENNQVISDILILINNNWKVISKENSYLCRIELSNNFYSTDLINSLIKVGIPFLKWPDLYFNSKEEAEYLNSYNNYINNIYLPLNISNNKKLIKETILKGIVKFINANYNCDIYHRKSFNGFYSIMINLKRKNKSKFKIEINYDINDFKKTIFFKDYKFFGDKNIINNENHLMIIKCKFFLKKTIYQNFNIFTGINKLDELIN